MIISGPNKGAYRAHETKAPHLTRAPAVYRERDRMMGRVSCMQVGVG